MCGFCGFQDKLSEEEKKKIIEKMTDRIIHRGPDSAGYFVDESVAIGFRRLSIIDLEGGSQPIYNEDKTLCVFFNGEIYNFIELRKSIPTMRLRYNIDRVNASDTSFDEEETRKALKNYGFSKYLLIGIPLVKKLEKQMENFENFVYKPEMLLQPDIQESIKRTSNQDYLALLLRMGRNYYGEDFKW